MQSIINPHPIGLRDPNSSDQQMVMRFQVMNMKPWLSTYVKTISLLIDIPITC